MFLKIWDKEATGMFRGTGTAIIPSGLGNSSQEKEMKLLDLSYWACRE